MSIKTQTFTGGGGGGGAVTSVNGQTGVVVISGDDVAADHSASHYTAANSNVDGHLSGIDTKLGTLASGLTYKGTFNATTGAPSLANAEQGDYYKIATGGTIYGQTWAINDSLLINADMGGSITNSKIDKIDNTEPTNVLITTNNLSDLDNAGTARTNLGLGNVATLTTGVSNGNVIVADSTGLPAIDGSQLTGITATDATKLAIANNLSDLNSASTARTNLGLATVASTGAYSDLSGTPSVGYPVQTATSSISATLNTAVLLTAGSATACTVTLPATSGASDGDVVIIVRRSAGELTIQQNGADSGTLLTYLDSGNASSFTITNNQQQIHVRYDSSGTRWYIYDKAQGTAALLDVGTSANQIVQLDGSSRLPAIDGSQLTGITATDSTKLAIANNLSDLNNAGTARTNLGLGNVATLTTGVANGNVIVADSTGLPAIDGSQLTGVTATDATKLAIANNLSDLNNAGTARTNLGLGNVATLTTGVANGNVIVADSTGLPAIDGSQLTGVTATDATKLAIANNLSDLNNAGTARTNLGLGNVATLTTGVSNGNVIVADSTGLPAIDGSQLTGITATDSTKLAIANNLSDLNSASTARTNLGLGTAATLNSGTGSSNLVQLNGSSQLPAVDGSNLTNVGKFTDYTTLSSNSNIFKNKGYNITANSLTLTLPARSTVTDGDSIAFTSAASYSVTIQLNSADTATSNIFYNVGSATNASSHTINLNKQEIFIRYNGSSFLITSETKGGIADVVSDTSPQLGGSLDVNGQDIVSVSNGDIEVAPDGNGSFIIKGNATSGSGRVVLNCEQNSHGITLKGPAHSAFATYQLVFPTSVGTDGQVLKTDGGDSGSPNSVQLAWVDQASGGGGYTYSAITSTTTAQLEYHYSCGANDETFTLNLPAVSGGDAGKEIRVKNMGTGTITIDGNSSSTIDGQTTITLDVKFSSVTLVATGNASASWEIV